MSIRFSYQTNYRLRESTLLKHWLIQAGQNEQKKIFQLSYTFLSDEELLSINQTHLNHDTYTDIITFDYSEKNRISAEIFISVDRVRDNAETQKVSVQRELQRVMVHGLLHCCGYKDKLKAEKELMRAQEDHYLLLLDRLRKNKNRK